MSLTTTIVEDRWNEACANPSIPRWRSLMQMAGELAVSIEAYDKHSIMVPCLRGVADAAQAAMIAMQPGRDE